MWQRTARSPAASRPAAATAAFRARLYQRRCCAASRPWCKDKSSAWVKLAGGRRARRAAPRGSAGPGRCKAAKLRVYGLATARFRGRFLAHTCDVASGLLDILASKNDGSTVDVCTWFCSSVSPGDSFQSSAAVLHPTTRLDAPEPNHIGQATCRRADGASITVIRTAVTYFYRRDSDQKN